EACWCESSRRLFDEHFSSDRCKNGSACPTNAALNSIAWSERKSPDGVADRIGPSEGPGPGSSPGRDTHILPCGCGGCMTVFEAVGRGSIPRRGAVRGWRLETVGLRKEGAVRS